MAKLSLCLSRLQGEAFAEHVWTDRIAIPQVAEHIAASAGLTLASDTGSALHGRLRRAWIGARHIRL